MAIPEFEHFTGSQDDPRQPATGLKFQVAYEALRSPEQRGTIFKIVGMLAAVVAAWLVFAAILSIFPWWMIVLTVIGLAGYLGVRQLKVQQRLTRIDAGFCGQCGYDLRGGNIVCPECGRDARLDEPVWRKLKREHAERTKVLEKLTRPTANKSKPVVPIDAPPTLPRPKLRPPPVDLAPIPVEGDDQKSDNPGPSPV